MNILCVSSSTTTQFNNLDVLHGGRDVVEDGILTE